MSLSHIQSSLESGAVRKRHLFQKSDSNLVTHCWKCINTNLVLSRKTSKIAKKFQQIQMIWASGYEIHTSRWIGTGMIRPRMLCPHTFHPQMIRPRMFHPWMSHNRQNSTNYGLVGHLAYSNLTLDMGSHNQQNSTNYGLVGHLA